MDNKKINNPLQTAYLRRYTLTEGKETGLKVIELGNNDLRVLLNESKALDIMQVWHKGVNMSFVSKNGFTAREIAFGRRFEGGMLYTCGLDAIGGCEGHEPHGNLHNTPARVLEVTQQEDTLRVKALMECTALFGENLCMERTVTLTGNRLRWEDKLLNRGAREEDYALLYHINFGYPMLDEGTKILADVDAVVPVTDHAAERLPHRTQFLAPVDNEEESCYYMQNKGDTVRVLNEKLGREVTLRYSADTLPCLVQWSSPATKDYALGIEPATSRLGGEIVYRQIQPEQSVDFFAELTFESK